MDHWLDTLGEAGFVVVRGPYAPDAMTRVSDAYDAAVDSATPDDVRVGSTTTRVSDFVNRGAAFDALYVFPPLLDAVRQVVGGPFRLSALHARTLRPHTIAQPLHVDVPRDSDAWPMLGFVLMVDAFRADNGATRFVPGSHHSTAAPPAEIDDEVQLAHACGDAGSLILFDASTWHGHSANVTDAPRRSIQGTFIPHGARPATDFAARMSVETRARLGDVARVVLGL